MGKKSSNLTKMFFSEITNNYDFNNIKLSFQDYLKSKNSVTDIMIIKYLKKIYSSSYLGLFIDPTKSKYYSSNNNIENICNGFYKYLKYRKIL